MFPKPKRIKDESALGTIRKMKCIVCGLVAEPHHIKSRGAGGDDTIENLLPLCRIHHTEIHTIGLKAFKLKYGFR